MGFGVILAKFWRITGRSAAARSWRRGRGRLAGRDGAEGAATGAGAEGAGARRAGGAATGAGSWRRGGRWSAESARGAEVQSRRGVTQEAAPRRRGRRRGIAAAVGNFWGFDPVLTGSIGVLSGIFLEVIFGDLK